MISNSLPNIDQQDVLNLEDADSEITITTVSTDDEKPTNVKPVAKPKHMEIPISKEFSKDQVIFPQILAPFKGPSIK